LQALFAGFLEADKACRSRHRVSGTTATLALVVGWELLVANVGDSAAFLDTGKEVIALSGNHRIDDNTAERARIEAAGGAHSESTGFSCCIPLCVACQTSSYAASGKCQ
jgi:serine/threonine protein phosphatase PrpC